MDYVNQSVELDHIDLSRDRLRVGYARLIADAMSNHFSVPGYSLIAPRWHFGAIAELRQGFDIFDATRPCAVASCNHVLPSRPEGDAVATVLRSTAFGEFRPVPKLTLALNGQAQYAWKPLLSFEEFSAGNYTVGRGYDPGVIIGDRGWGTQAEIRYGSRVPASANGLAVEGYGFWDHAAIHNLDRSTEVFGRHQLNSIGAGARIAFNRFALDAGLAFPLTRIGLENRRPPTRFLVSLTTRLWPWSYQ
jgi:hemolysin activation/secretion protein